MKGEYNIRIEYILVRNQLENNYNGNFEAKRFFSMLLEFGT